MNQKLQDNKIDIKIKIAVLWLAMMSLYIYNDFFHLFTPGSIQNIMDGNMGPFETTQVGVLGAAVLMAIPVGMSILAVFSCAKINRIANIAMGILYTIVNIANLPGETWIFYIFLGTLEIIITLAIIYLAFKWPKAETTS